MNVKITKSIGMLLLSIYLIIVGLSGALGFSLGQLAFVCILVGK